MLALLLLALSIFLAPYILSSVHDFRTDPYGFQLHFSIGRVLKSLIIAWFALFVGMCVRHRTKAVWGVLLIPLVLASWILWRNSIL
jgi:hypothetical protein